MTDKPSRPEEEYFAREEQTRREKDALLRRQREREERKLAHYMKCPKCGADLKTEVLDHVEIDRCSDCSGVWLDGGELEKLAGGEPKRTRGFFDLFLGKKS